MLTIGATTASEFATTPSTLECRPNRRLPRSTRSGFKDVRGMNRILGPATDIVASLTAYV